MHACEYILYVNLYVYAAHEGPGVVIAHPGQDVELLCTVTPSEIRTAAWVINNNGPYAVQRIHNGILLEYSSNGYNLLLTNIKMNDDRNDTEYNCVTIPSTVNNPTLLDIVAESDLIVLYVAGE